MNHADMSLDDVRDLAGKADAIANLAADLERVTGVRVRIDLTGAACVSFPLFAAPAAEPSGKVSDAEFAAALGCAPAAVPVPLLVPAKAAALKPEPKAGGVKYWTAAEDARAVAMVEAGHTAEEIAADLGRPVMGTKWRLQTKLKRQYDGRVQTATIPRTVDQVSVEPVPAPASVAVSPPADLVIASTPPAAPGFTMLPVDGTSADRHMHAHLDDLGYPGKWSPRLDSDMLAALGRGAKFGAVCVELELDHKLAVARFNALAACVRVDGRFTIEAQSRLTVALRERADAAEARVA